MSPPPASHLLRDAALGNDRAVRECVARFGPIVWGLARRLSPTRADAEDAVQEIFLDLWTHGGRYDAAKGTEEAFVAVIARRRLIDRRRHAARRPALEAVDSAAEPSTSTGSAEAVAEVALVNRAMGELRPEQREVLRLSVAQGFTHEEISARIGMPLGTVKAHARRGLMRIRAKLLGEEMGEERFAEEPS
jgi:RNA polymerase sigma-70 factor (ECF subfamily)